MKIMIDLQGRQSTASGRRGIGRYSLALASSLLDNKGDNEFWILLNSSYSISIDEIYSHFDSRLNPNRIIIFDVPPDSNGGRLSVLAEQSRLAAIRLASPDILIISSVFEGFQEQAVVSIDPQADYHTVVLLYDLIPYLRPEWYLKDPIYKAWYYRRLNEIRRADFILAISESTRREAIEVLGLTQDNVVKVGAGFDNSLITLPRQTTEGAQIPFSLGITRPFVLYTGGIDPRKNVEGLIQGFALLPATVRDAHQLVIVCSIDLHQTQRLYELAKLHGLRDRDVCLTGYISDLALLALYRACQLFVFPSLHEGFGLPALEAMAAGAPTIGANNSGIAEVIALSEALFDESDPRFIAEKMVEGLTDASLRERLIDNGLRRSKLYTWEDCARKTISALADKFTRSPRSTVPVKRWMPRMAFVSPLPPLRTGVAAYAADLLPSLSRFYDIDLVTDQINISDIQLASCFPHRSVSWFRHHSSIYDRIVYQVGNSPFHDDMLTLLDEIPGVVDLHDVFIGHLQHWRQHYHQWPDHYLTTLIRSHGYAAVADYTEKGEDFTIWEYPLNSDVISRAAGIIAHSQYGADLLLSNAPPLPNTELRSIGLPIKAARAAPPDVRQQLNLQLDDFVICSFGVLGEHKCNEMLLDAFLMSDLAQDSHSKLFFVGSSDDDEYCQRILRKITQSGIDHRIFVTGYISDKQYENFLHAADCAVQLRWRTRGEASKTVLDCMAHSVVTIVNAEGSMKEFDDTIAISLPQIFSVDDLARSIERLRNDSDARGTLIENAIHYVTARHSTSFIADKYAAAVEAFAAKSRQAIRRSVIDAAMGCDARVPNAADMTAMAASIASNFPTYRFPRLYVDISELVQRDAKTGIQRVVRAILMQLLREPPAGYMVEPIYVCHEGDWHGYRLATTFTLGFLQCPIVSGRDDIAEFQSGDVFLGLDLNAVGIKELYSSGFFTSLRTRKVRLVVVVYDLIPVMYPEFFGPGAYDIFSHWLSVLANVCDEIVCISNSVACELTEWLRPVATNRARPASIGIFHLGADVKLSVPTGGLPDNAEVVLNQMRKNTTVISVGTLEPRKSHALMLEIFDCLWSSGYDCILVFVGKLGWMMGNFSQSLERHPEYGRRLFWISDASDEYLDLLYNASSGLLMASKAEGFGLPLIEAARYGIPIMARDIPVFREVAGGHASFFAKTDPSDIAVEIAPWIIDIGKGNALRSSGMSWLTWRESAQQLIHAVLPRGYLERWALPVVNE